MMSNDRLADEMGTPMDSTQNADRRGGFSLLEAMIALVILAIGIFGATAGHIAAAKNSSDSRLQTFAMDLAEEQIEIMRIMSPADVLALASTPNDSANPIDPDPGDGATMKFNRSWIIQDNTPEDDVIAITVNVTWVNAVGNTRTVRVQTLKADL